MHPPIRRATLQRLRALLTGNEVCGLISLFQTTMEMRLAALRAAGRNADVAACHSIALSLRGGCGLIGAPHLMELCVELEALTQTGTRAALRTCIARMQVEYGRVAVAVERERRQEGELIST